ncbi:MAG: double-strand break repair helicase AddA [Pseudomonadota bacterium]
MTPPKRDAATERQVEAADPAFSVWLGANAGSGKTRVLTDRVARLLLSGVSPQNVLCLTYTKAAASEMQNRLFRRLGTWAMEEDAALAARLDKLGVSQARGPDTLARARRLFARAIETPGGLKIQTIHSFCAAILRRFPLEAGVTPGFTEMDAEDAAQLQSEVVAQLARDEPETVSALAAHLTDPDFSSICAEILGQGGAFPPQPARTAILDALGLPANAGCERLIADVATSLDAADLAALHSATARARGKQMQAFAPVLARWGAEGLTDAVFGALRAHCLTAEDAPAARALAKPVRAEIDDGLEKRFDEMVQSIVAAVDGFKALDVAEKTLALQRFAAAFLPAYEVAKATHGLLDFDDLIRRTHRLLSTPGLADWVLFRLDGGIEHVLVDEAQDTSPLQWQVIDRLTREFTDGEGRAHPGDRTLFVVGDVKQSIYSFQGAAPESFDAMRETFGARLAQVGARLNRLELEFSFRSAAPILEAVEATFHPGNRAGLGAGDWAQHRPFKVDLPGRVELWPMRTPGEKADEMPWWQPLDQPDPEHHRTLLARDVARAASQIIGRQTIRDEAGAPRPAHAGDILVLVQSRGPLFHEIIAACKDEGITVAGADVLKLGEELAVRDLLSLLRFLDTPEDDLSLAEALRSPLFGWSEDALYRLAHGRDGRYLWQELRGSRGRHSDTVAMLDDLRDQADFERPYDLLERILTRHGGRRRLVARLGEEATDGIDALLARALAHERHAVPSLTGFIAEQDATSIDVKRQAEGRGDKLRVMTVHGSKGLESPIVILPDTGEQNRLRKLSARMLPGPDGAPVWTPGKDDAPARVRTLRDAAIEKRVEESRRLLYVAMTRAEQWLIVGGAGKPGTRGDTWYEQIHEGLTGAEALPHPNLEGGLILQSTNWPPPKAPAAGRVPNTGTETRTPDTLPGWALSSVSAPVRRPPPLSPSNLGGAKALAGADALPEAEATARGSRIHLLLEDLAGHPPGLWAERAEALLPDPTERADALDEASAVLSEPALAHLFAPDALTEVSLVAHLPALGSQLLSGAVDRLMVTADTVLAIDFKTNATVPTHPADVPEGLLRQMGAYAAALREIYSVRRVETALLWTRTATLMPLPQALIDAALARAGSAVQERT